jgi:CRP/FNR family transcriptional regulator, anaerobic regulatory protein
MQKTRPAAATDERSPGRLGATGGSAISGGKASLCLECRLRASCICNALLDVRPGDDGLPANQIGWQTHKRPRAHKNIKSAGEPTDRVYVICEGWAFRFVQLPDGRKQILSILIPGDLVTPTRLFDDTVRLSVQAMTDVRYCGYSRSMLRARLTSDLALLDAWAKILLAEHRWNIGLVIDLGSRSADERIAHLILALKTRLERRGMTVGDSLPFPLSQRLIAEATGLSPEHVSRVLGKFRSEDVIETAKGVMRILDLPGLQRVGALNF